MRKTIWWVVFTEAVGALSALFTMNGMRLYAAEAAKPPLTPPPVVFLVVWFLLYALMGISIAGIAKAGASSEKSLALKLFFVQLAANFVWSLIFFNAAAYGFAFIWLILLWVLILAMIMSFYKVDAAAAYLQIPYLLWVTFAGYLNFGVWRLN